MSVTLKLQPDIETELRRKAAKGGLTLEDLLCQLAEREACRPVNGTLQKNNEDEENKERPWRGIFVLPGRRKEIPLALELPAGNLPKREPSPNMNWHRLEGGPAVKPPS
jgi:hypothetical protein